MLYLFVVMLLNVKQDDRYHRQWPDRGLVGLPLAHRGHRARSPAERGVVAAGLAPGRNRSRRERGTIPKPSVKCSISTYLFPFEVASLILLVAMIGAIILAKRSEGRLKVIREHWRMTVRLIRMTVAMLPSYYLILSAIVFLTGVVGVLIRRNIIIILLSVELMLNATNINFVAFSRILPRCRRARSSSFSP